MRSAIIVAAVAAITFVLSAAAPAEITEFAPRGFSLTKEIIVPGTPVEVFDGFTGDVSPWWDHHVSENPLRLVIEPEVGGAFREDFDEEGNGVIHAEVIAAHRGRMLKLRGPFGFSGAALDLVHTFRFEAVEDNRTRVTLLLNGLGQIDDGGVQALDHVWDHFLVEQFQAWMEAGQPGR